MRRIAHYLAQVFVGFLLFLGIQRLWLICGLPYLDVRQSGLDLEVTIGTAAKVLATLMFVAGQIAAYLLFRTRSN